MQVFSSLKSLKTRQPRHIFRKDNLNHKFVFSLFDIHELAHYWRFQIVDVRLAHVSLTVTNLVVKLAQLHP